MDLPHLHLFNPDNDLALAADVEYYTPTSAGRRMRRAGALLPLHWAKPGDALLVEPPNAGRISEAVGSLRPDVEVISKAEKDYAPDPWGWSRAARRDFMRAGIRQELLPDDSQLDAWRNLSHRRTTVRVHELLGMEPPVECRDVDAAMDALRAFGGAGVVKLPWSCSGRGVVKIEDASAAWVAPRIEAMLRRQKSVMVERLCRDVEADFALLLRFAPGGEIVERHLSLFRTDSGVYRGNYLLGDAEIMDRLNLPDPDILDRTSGAVAAVMHPAYTGWAGIDMMKYGGGRVNPCVEINLRRTMGVVAAYMYLNGCREEYFEPMQ